MLTGCNTPDSLVRPFIPRHFSYSRIEIEKRIHDRWRYEKKVLGVFEVKIDSPKVRLLPESNRLRCAFNMTLRRPFSSNVVKGTITVAGMLRFDNASRTISLVNTEVEAMDAEGLPVNDPVLQTISALFGGTLTDIKLYELKSEDLRFAGVQFDPIQFTVKPDEVEVELEARSKHPAEE